MEKITITKNKKRKTQPKREITSKGVYENGIIKLSGDKLPKKKMNVVVTFREGEKDEIQNKEKAVNNFLKKWSNVIKTSDVQLVMERKLDYLVEKQR